MDEFVGRKKAYGESGHCKPDTWIKNGVGDL